MPPIALMVPELVKLAVRMLIAPPPAAEFVPSVDNPPPLPKYNWVQKSLAPYVVAEEPLIVPAVP